MTKAPGRLDVPRAQHLVRQDVLRFYRDRALSETPLTTEDFAEQLAVVYCRTVPEHARSLELVVPPTAGSYREYAQAVRRLDQRVRRYVDGSLHLPVELEEPWVEALPDPYRAACKAELARRYGFLGARAPRADPCSDGEAVGYILEEVGDLTGALSQALADGKIGPEDFDGSGRLLREVDDAAAAIASVRARVVEAARAAGVDPVAG